MAMTFKNQKSIDQIRLEEELSKLPQSDLYEMMAEINMNFSRFISLYFSKFPEQE